MVAPSRPLRVDPSRTAMIRRRFLVDMGRRFNDLRKAIDRLVGDEDAFGVAQRPTKPQHPLQLNTRFQFKTDADKVKGFQDWLEEQVKAGVLQTVGGVKGKPWTATHVESAYKQGLIRAYVDSQAARMGRKNTAFATTQEQFLRQSFAQAEAVGKISLISTRAYDALKGVSAKMSADMGRTCLLYTSRCV